MNIDKLSSHELQNVTTFMGEMQHCLQNTNPVIGKIRICPCEIFDQSKPVVKLLNSISFKVIKKTKEDDSFKSYVANTNIYQALFLKNTVKGIEHNETFHQSSGEDFDTYKPYGYTHYTSSLKNIKGTISINLVNNINGHTLSELSVTNVKFSNWPSLINLPLTYLFGKKSFKESGVYTLFQECTTGKLSARKTGECHK